jgi:hypothetical protein
MASVQFAYDNMYEVDANDLQNGQQYTLSIPFNTGGPGVTSTTAVFPQNGAITEYPIVQNPVSSVTINSCTYDATNKFVVVTFTPNGMNSATKVAVINMTVTVGFDSTSSVSLSMATALTKMNQAINFPISATDSSQPNITFSSTLDAGTWTYPFNLSVTVTVGPPSPGTLREGTAVNIPVTATPARGSNPSVVSAYLTVIVNFAAK